MLATKTVPPTWIDAVPGFLEELVAAVSAKVAIELLAIPIAGFIIWLLYSLWRQLVRFIDGGDSRRRLERVRSAINNPGGLWITEPIEHPDNYQGRILSSIPIITVANLKGGVGKTTISANLAAHLATADTVKEGGGVVLLIDFDFQGSLSSMMDLPDAQRRPNAQEDSLASQLLDANRVRGASDAWPHRVNQNLRCVPAYYDLAQAENRIMIEWLIEDRPHAMPYALADALHDQAVQDPFDAIIIDAPPRLTTSMIQSLCASTHVLIPTIMDRLSAEAVTTFVDQIETLKARGICPYLNYAGIIGNDVGQGGDPEGTARTMIDGLIDSGHEDVPLLDPAHWIPTRAALSRNAGSSIAYLEAEQTADRTEVRRLFDTVGPAIWENVRRRA